MAFRRCELFRTAAEAEPIDAEETSKAMEGIGETTDNLQAAINGETYEYKDMYPPMLDQAKADDHRPNACLGMRSEQKRFMPSCIQWRLKQ